MRKPASVKLQYSRFRASLKGISRAITSGREAAKLQLAKLTGKIVKGLGELHSYSDDIRCEVDNFRHACWDRHRLGDGLRHNFNIGQNSRLTGVDHVVAELMAPKHAA